MALPIEGKSVFLGRRVAVLTDGSRDDRGPEHSIFVGDLGPEVNEFVLVSISQPFPFLQIRQDHDRSHKWDVTRLRVC